MWELLLGRHEPVWKPLLDHKMPMWEPLFNHSGWWWEPLFNYHALTWRLLSCHVSRIGEPLLSHSLPLLEPLLKRNGCRWKPGSNSAFSCGYLWSTAFPTRGNPFSTASSSYGSHCSTASFFLLWREKLVFKRTAQIVQRGTSIALCTDCVVDSLSTTVTLGQSLEETKRWVNTSLKSNLRRRLTDLASQSICGLYRAN